MEEKRASVQAEVMEANESSHKR